MTLDPARGTIFALSSGSPPAAIAIVRISGPAVRSAVVAFGVRVPTPRKASLVSLRDGEGALLDRALLLWFPGPDSATGEDLAELHLHGGRATVAAVLAALGRIDGLRMAEPGEFTRRAFEHGRIDLAQAEGLGDLLSAETEGQRRNALRTAEGGIGALIERWRVQLLGLASRIEAEIEFGDEDDGVAVQAIDGDLNILIAELRAAIAVPPAERLRDGVRILLAGPPNSGKSTLINALVGRPVALATPVPGTTRDLIEAPVILSGVACILIDSAGLHEASADIVEELGMTKTRWAIETADLILWLGHPDDRPEGAVIVASRCDLIPPVVPYDVAVSGMTGEGIGDLRELIGARVDAKLPREDQIAMRERYRLLLGDLIKPLTEARNVDDPVIRAELFRAGLASLDRLIGRSGVEDMLDELFGRFCIGK